MTATLQPEVPARSRRALLAGALGGISALAATAIGRASPVRAADGDVVHVGDPHTSTTVTRITNTTADATAIRGDAAGLGWGLLGTSVSGPGVKGFSDGDVGVNGGGPLGVYGGGDNRGVFGVCNGDYGTSGVSQADMTGVVGFSGDAAFLPAAKAKTGVYGYAAQDGSSKGVYGESPAGWAGYFVGRVYLSKYQEMSEVSTPSAPGANKARLFVRDNGAGKTQLCVRFNTGAVKVLATQP